jgi:hypothetical protein
MTHKAELAKCPCGAIPGELQIYDAGQGPKYLMAQGSCCGEWMIEFRNGYNPTDDQDCMQRAIEAWNASPRPNGQFSQR